MNAKRQGTRISRACLVIVTCAAGASPLAGQTNIVTATTGEQGSGIGASLARVGDLDADGIPDWVTGDPSRPGAVFLFSGADGSVLYKLSTPTIGIDFGTSCAGGQDLDGDTVPDILIGAPLGSTGMAFAGNGSVHVYSGATKGLLREHVGDAFQGLGRSVTFLDDLDGDGIAEYASGAFQQFFAPPPDSPGEAFVYSGATGDVLYAMAGIQPGDDFGWIVEQLDDIDGDGVPDLGIGAPSMETNTEFPNGAVFLHSGATGALIRMDTGPETNWAGYGNGLAALDDVDGDGISEYATSWYTFDPKTFEGEAHRILVVSGATGAVLLTAESPLAPQGGLGFGFGGAQVVALPDLDGDGLRDVMLANRSDDVEAHAFVASSASGAPLLIIPRDGARATFPGVLEDLGDLDGDGLNEVGMSAGVIQDGDVVSAIVAYSLRPLHALATEISASAGGVVPFGLTGGIGCAGAPYVLLAGVHGSTPGFRVGDVTVPLVFDAITAASVGLANVPPFVDTLGTLDDVTGRGAASFDLTGVTLPPAAVGATLTFAYVAKCGPGPWSFASNAEDVLVVP